MNADHCCPLVAGYLHSYLLSNLRLDSLFKDAMVAPDLRVAGVESFLAPHECEEMINIINQIGLNPPSPKDLHPKKGEAFLCRESFAFEDPALGEKLSASECCKVSTHLH